MNGKDLIVKQLDLLVEMFEYCSSKDKSGDRVECSKCPLFWNFNACCRGCFLINVIDDKFMSALINICEAHDIDYKEKIDRIDDIFDAWE